MHGFQPSIIIDDIMTDWHSEAGIRYPSIRWCWKNIFIFRRQQNVLSESPKNQYNAYI